LRNVPVELASLRNLGTIYVGGSPALDFRKLIALLSQLPSLEGIGLDDNNMHTVPDNIGCLKACKRLGLSSNDLATLPPEIGSLTSLESLDLYNNRLREVPPDVRQLRSLKKIFIKDSGLSTVSMRKLFPDADIVAATPPEIYLQLK
jgi:Leucine-rich repeat (LRR) protein